MLGEDAVTQHRLLSPPWASPRGHSCSCHHSLESRPLRHHSWGSQPSVPARAPPTAKASTVRLWAARASIHRAAWGECPRRGVGAGGCAGSVRRGPFPTAHSPASAATSDHGGVNVPQESLSLTLLQTGLQKGPVSLGRQAVCPGCARPCRERLEPSRVPSGMAWSSIQRLAGPIPEAGRRREGKSPAAVLGSRKEKNHQPRGGQDMHWGTRSSGRDRVRVGVGED